jgi:hypothetical protein
VHNVYGYRPIHVSLRDYRDECKTVQFLHLQAQIAQSLGSGDNNTGVASNQLTK